MLNMPDCFNGHAEVSQGQSIRRQMIQLLRLKYANAVGAGEHPTQSEIGAVGGNMCTSMIAAVPGAR